MEYRLGKRGEYKTNQDNIVTVQARPLVYDDFPEWQFLIYKDDRYHIIERSTGLRLSSAERHMPTAIEKTHSILWETTRNNTLYNCVLSALTGTGIINPPFTIEEEPEETEDEENEDIIKCVNCDCIIEEDDVQLSPDAEEKYCEDCYNEKYGHCEHCEETVSMDDLHEAYNRDGNNIYICDRCLQDHFFTCCHCDEIYNMDSRYLTPNGDYTCGECYSENYFQCETCRDDYHNNDYAQDYQCVNCYHDNPDGIYNSEHKPSPVFHGKGSDVYGMELETDKYNDISSAAENLASDENDYYMKEDGSLSNGIEVVFHPRTVESWNDYMPELKEITGTVREHGGSSFDTDTCGVHIHRNRDGISEVDIAKLISVFVKCRDNIMTIAQRRNSSYASFDYYENETGGDYKLVYKKVKAGDFTGQRYVAINLQNHSTIEFRIFKGTLKIESLQAYLIFCDSIISWCKGISLVKILDNAPCKLWDMFLQYLGNKGKNGKLLLKYIEEKQERRIA